MQIMEGDLGRTVEKNLSRIAHIQLADNPGRNEPGTGEINYPFLFGQFDRDRLRRLDRLRVQAEGKTEEGLGWFTRADRARSMLGHGPSTSYP